MTGQLSQAEFDARRQQNPGRDLHRLGQLTAAAVAEVELVIRRYVRLTPDVTIDRAELGLPAGPLTLKLEQLQHSGSFKARGAFANLLLRDIPPAGVVAASGGNHGAAVAYAAGVLGVPARVFVRRYPRPPRSAGSAATGRPGGDRSHLLRGAGRQRRAGLAAAARCRSTRSTRPRRSSAPALPGLS